jgi:molecular chaperone DnaJ
MDFYLLLGLGAEATTADIKRAYRRLSRRYHPGVNPGDGEAAALFQRISEAYETLVNPQTRQKYDSTGRATTAQKISDERPFEFAGFDFSVAAQGAQAATFTELFADVLHPPAHSQGAEHGSDLHASLTVSFVEAIQGTRRQVVVTRQEVCVPCQGRGHVRTPEGRCGHCQGTGKIRWARGHMVFSKACTPCAGTGRLTQQRCAVCTGHGRVVRAEAIRFDIPPGTNDGARLRIAERGHAGRNGGRTGDLYVTVLVEPHRLFWREGDDLYLQIPLAVHEAVLGTRIEVPSFDGPVRLRIPPGTQAGKRFRVSQYGVVSPTGTRGDLVVEVVLVLPQIVDERSKELMREFGRLNNEDVRRDLSV